MGLTIASGSCVNTMTTSIYINFAIGIFSPVNPGFDLSVYPNPFNGSTNINLQLQEKSEVTMEIVNSVGQVVSKVQSREILDEGIHSFATPNLPEGIYFIRINCK